MASKRPKSILYKHSHVAYQSKVMKSRKQWCKHFAPGGGGGACLGVTTQSAFYVNLYRAVIGPSG